MPAKPKPEGSHDVTPYLMVRDVPRLIEFTERVFHAKEHGERFKRPDGGVMHAEVRIGDSIIMMGEPMGKFQPMPCALYVYVDDTDTAYKRALEAGAESLMPPADQFYGDRSAGVKDSMGNLWWIATHIEDVSPEEIERRGQEFMRKQRA